MKEGSFKIPLRKFINERSVVVGYIQGNVIGKKNRSACANDAKKNGELKNAIACLEIVEDKHLGNLIFLSHFRHL